MKRLLFFICIITAAAFITSCQIVDDFKEIFGIEDKSATEVADENKGSNVGENETPKDEQGEEPKDPTPTYSVYVITYNDGMNGAGLEGAPVTYRSDITSAITLPRLTKNGYNFIGWKENGEYVETIAVGSTGNKEFIAVWETVRYTITYVDELGGEGLENAPRTYDVESSVTLPTLTKEGYDFLGWEKADGTVIRKIPVGSFGDITLTAYYEGISETFTVSYVNSLVEPDYYLKSGEYVSTYNSNTGITVDLPVLDAECFTFGGWETQHGDVISSIPQTSSEDLTLTAKWTEIQDENIHRINYYAYDETTRTYEPLTGLAPTRYKTDSPNRIKATLPTDLSPAGITPAYGYGLFGWKKMNDSGDDIADNDTWIRISGPFEEDFSFVANVTTCKIRLDCRLIIFSGNERIGSAQLKNTSFNVNHNFDPETYEEFVRNGRILEREDGEFLIDYTCDTTLYPFLLLQEIVSENGGYRLTTDMIAYSDIDCTREFHVISKSDLDFSFDPTNDYDSEIVDEIVIYYKATYSERKSSGAEEEK